VNFASDRLQLRAFYDLIDNISLGDFNQATQSINGVLFDFNFDPISLLEVKLF